MPSLKLSLAQLALAIFLAGGAAAQEKPRLTARVEVSGKVKRNLSLTVKDLQAIAARKGGPVAANSVAAELPPAYRGYVDVRLSMKAKV